MDHSEVKNFPKVDHTPAELDDLSRALLKAADYIERHGWQQEFLGCGGGPVCVLGGIYYANEGRYYITAAGRLMDSLGGRADQWNDRPGRTQAEVVAKLRAVALGL